MRYYYEGQDQAALFVEKRQGVFELKEEGILDVLTNIVCPRLKESYRVKLTKALKDVDNPDFFMVHSTNSYELFALSTLATESENESYSAEVPELLFTTDENFDSSKFIRMDVDENNLEEAKLRLEESNLFNKKDIYLIKQDCVEEGSKVSYIVVYIPDRCFSR